MISRMFAEFEQRKKQLESRDADQKVKAKEEQAHHHPPEPTSSPPHPPRPAQPHLTSGMPYVTCYRSSFYLLLAAYGLLKTTY